MKKIYQNSVKTKANEIVNTLIDINFFNDFDIKDHSFAYEYFCDKITEKFIEGEIDIENEPIFTEQEFDKCLNAIIVVYFLNQLKTKGLVNSFEDENDKELFFLTEEGKNMAKNIRKNI